MVPLRITSCQAANTFPAGKATAAYLAGRLGTDVQFDVAAPWQERVQALEAGAIEIGCICGSYYVQQGQRPEPAVELLATPVMAEARYEDRPVYFSDVVVHRDSPFHTFADLRGASWAYNEPNSFSGYYAMSHYLDSLGETAGYFSRAVHTGAHVNSLKQVCRREVDCAAIDSTVLFWRLARRPQLREQIRVVATLGPNMAPPWIISTRVSAELRERIQALLLGMHLDPAGQRALAAGGLRRFAATTPADYEPIRSALDRAALITIAVTRQIGSISQD